MDPITIRMHVSEIRDRGELGGHIVLVPTHKPGHNLGVFAREPHGGRVEVDLTAALLAPFRAGLRDVAVSIAPAAADAEPVAAAKSA